MKPNTGAASPNEAASRSNSSGAVRAHRPTLQPVSPPLLRTHSSTTWHRKAIIALAHKFLSIIYYTLKNNWIFEDFPNFVLAEAKT
jgi:hypothetical protein